MELKSLNGKLNIGDVFFINAKGLRNFGVCKETGMIGYKYGEVPIGCADLLLAVKYIGNGIVEEMISGENILLGGQSELYYRDRNLPYDDFKNVEFGKEYSISSSVEEGLKLIEGKKIAVYIDKLIKTKNKALEFPLTFLEPDNKYEVTEESKKVYLRHDNDERRKIILVAKEQAKVNFEQIEEVVDGIIEKFSINSENLDMAYLENDLFNFRKKKY